MSVIMMNKAWRCADIFHYAERVEQTVPLDHALHCMDSIRRPLICNFESLLSAESSETGIIWGDGQSHVCRDWESFMDWVELHAKII